MSGAPPSLAGAAAAPRKAAPGQKIVRRSITGVLDDAAGTPPGSPQPAQSKKPKASRRVSGIWDSSTEPGVAGHRASIESVPDEIVGVGGDVDPDAVLTAALDTDAPIKNLLLAIAEHPTVSRLQWMGIEALANMAPGNADARAKIAAHGGPSLVCAAMGRFREDEKLQAKGCWAMANGSQDQEDVWVSHGAVAALTNAVAHASACASREEVTQEQYDSAASRFMIASRAFKNLVKTKAAAERASECGTVTVLRDGIDVFKKDPMAQWRGEEAIGSIERMMAADE